MGLGNPGPRFDNTRHNVGFKVVEALADRLSLTFRKPLFRSWLEVHGDMMHLAKPLTFMNRSGSVLPALLRKTRTTSNELIVVVDNMDLPAGTVRIKRRGESRGHNGIASILDTLGSGDFVRVYVGIGRPEPGITVVDHVLGQVPESQAETYAASYSRAADSIEALVTRPIDEVMNTVNRN